MIILSGASGGIAEELVDYIDDKNIIGLYNKNKIKNDYKYFKKIKIDLSVEKNVKNLIYRNKKYLNNITLLLMHGYSYSSLLINDTQQNWEKTFKINVISNFNIIKYILPLMISQKWGRIIFFSSITSKLGIEGTSAYSASKSALYGLSSVISKEYGSLNITSNIIELGYFEKGMINDVTNSRKSKLLNQIPNKKFGKVKNIANIINAINKSEYLNKSIIKIDGAIY